MCEHHLFDDFELIGEGDTREGDASYKCSRSYIRNVAVLTECHTHEMATASERKLWNALKFGTSGEVNTKKGRTIAEGWELAPPNCSGVGSLQVELNGAVREAPIPQPVQQCLRTKLIFDVRIDYHFLD